MPKNESLIDRVIRLIVGLALFAYAYINMTDSLQVVSYVIAAILVFTGITGFCLIYRIFSFSTAKTTPSSEKSDEVEEMDDETDDAEDDE